MFIARSSPLSGCSSFFILCVKTIAVRAQSIFFGDKYHEIFTPLDLWSVPIANNEYFAKGCILPEIIFAINIDHSIACTMVLQTNQRHTHSELDGQQGHPVGHFFMGIEIA